MRNDFRALCAELTEFVARLTKHYYEPAELLTRARAALADGPAVPEGREPASVAGQPSDQQLLEVMPQQFHDDLATVSRMAAHGAGPDVDPGLFRVSLNTGVVDFARAVLARWGKPTPVPLTDGEVDCISIDEMCEILRSLGIKAAEYTDCTILYELTFEQLRAICDTRAFALSRRTPAAPADGEVAELMEGLRLISDGMSAIGHDSDSWFVARAAELLQRQALVPVPVSERLPGPEDCDAEGRCWLRGKVEGDWRLLNPNNSGVPQLKYCFTHWLPAHALPIPQQQENAND